MNLTFQQLEQEYTDTLDNLGQIYMPVFESSDTNQIYPLLVDYFAASGNTALNPLEKRELAAALAQMMIRSSDIQWIALYVYLAAGN